jgi:hypothetical protein
MARLEPALICLMRSYKERPYFGLHPGIRIFNLHYQVGEATFRTDGLHQKIVDKSQAPD